MSNQEAKSIEKRYDSQGIEKVMSTKDYIGDATGQISMNSIGALTGQMTYFYTEKVGMNPAAVGLILMVSKITDGVSDLIMGRLVDKTNTKDGKARPWLKRMIIPTFLAMLLLFTMPRVSEGLQIGYGVLTNIFANAVVYTAIAVPFYTMINYMTRSLEERGKIGTTRSIFGNLLQQAVGISLFPITNALGGTQKAWVIYAAGLGLIGSITLTVCFKCTKERYKEDVKEGEKSEDEKISVFKSLKILIHNKYWVMMALSQMALSCVYAYLYGSLAYYCKWVGGNDNLAGFINTLGLLPMVIGFISTPVMISKLGMRKTGIAGAVIGIVGTIIRLIAPANVTIFCLGFCLVTFATVPIVSVLPAMVVNCAEWNDYKYGVRLAGMTNSAASFGAKIGNGFGSALMGWILVWGGYKAEAAVQTPSALTSIYAMNIWIPGILLALIMVFYGLYDLEKKYPEIVEANNRRREK